MFNIIIDGEVIETVMYDDYNDTYRYVTEEYPDENFIIRKVVQ